ERDYTEYDRISDGVSKENEIIYEYITLNKKRIVYENGTFKLKNDLRNFVEISTLFYVVNHYVKFEKNQQKLSDKRKQFVNKLKELNDLGILVSQKIDNKVYYALSDICINSLIITEAEDYLCRFSDMISFFSEVSPLGEAGDYILNRLEMTKSTVLFYKHHYLKVALNDYNIIDLLYAIKNELWIDVEYRNSSVNDMKYQRLLCYPIEIRESVNDGRQYLIYYHPGYRSVSALRIEFIDNITIGEYELMSYFENDLSNAKKLITHTWGTAFSDFKNGNVKSVPVLNEVRLVIQCSEREGFIRRRAERELRSFSEPKNIMIENIGQCIEFVMRLANTEEIMQWLRSYITRIVILEINGKSCLQFTDEMAELYRMYCAPMSDPQKKTDFSVIDKINMMESIDPEIFTERESIHTWLFNEYFSNSFIQSGEILDQFLCEEELTNEYFEDYVSDYVKVDDEKTKKSRKNIRTKQLSNFADAFVKRIEGKNTSIFKLSKSSKIGSIKELVPMTKVERQWLLCVLCNPLSNCFLSQEEKDSIIANIKPDTWNEIFDINSIIYYDQFMDVNDVYYSDSVANISRNILKALNKKHKISVTYEDQNGHHFTDVCSPAYIEYSKRDNRFRLQVVCDDNTIKTYNFERIKEVNIIPDKNYKHKYVNRTVRDSVRQHELHIVFTGDKNVPDRILTEFSCFKKRCVKWGDDTYRMILTYDEPDTKEIVIRLLSYGTSICIYNDTGKVRSEMIERIERQMELINTMQMYVDKSELEKE
ncbi:MAG: WYL domain-containing protein, partial [Ruminococcus sp.]